jgi:hypothetical protein
MDSQALELARESVGRTRREHTAELWYRDNFTFLRDWREWADEDRQTGEAHPELVWDWLNHGLHSAAPAGRIEFDRDRALYSTGDEWRLSVDGNLYSGEPGDWEEDERDAPMSEAEPHWLLAIAEACVEAEAVSSLMCTEKTGGVSKPGAISVVSRVAVRSSRLSSQCRLSPQSRNHSTSPVCTLICG